MAGARSVIINLVANDRVTDTVRGIGKQFDKLNGQVRKMAAPAMAAAGAAAGAAFVGGVTGAIQMDSARGKLEAQLGLTKAQSKGIGEVAGKLYADAYGESMQDVQTAITSVIQNMDGMRTASSAALQETTARAMSVATVMEEDVGAVTRAVAQMMRTGLAKNAKEAFDIITAGTQKGANKAQDLLDTFNEYGTQFRRLGLDGKTAMALISQGLQAGARDSDQVADAIGQFGERALAGGKPVNEAFKSIGLNADVMAKKIGAGGSSAQGALGATLNALRGTKDEQLKLNVAAALFGDPGIVMGKALFALNPAGSAAAKTLGQVTGATDRAGKALGETAQARFTSFTRTLQQDVMGALGATIGWFQKHTTVAKVLAGAVVALVAAYATYNVVAGVMAARTALMTAGTVANTIATKIAAGASKAWAAAQWVLNAAMTANPIGIVIAVIVALVAAVVIAYKKSDTFRAIVQAAWAGIRSAIATAWGFIKPVFDVIKSVVGKVLPIAFTVLKNVAKSVWIGIQIAVKAAWALIKPILTAIKWTISRVIGPVFRWLYNNVVKPVFSQLRSHISKVWNSGVKPVFNALKSAVGKVGGAFKVAVAAIKKHWDKIQNIAKKPVNFVIGVYNKGIVGVVNKVADFALGKGKGARLTEIKPLARGGTLGNPATARPMVTNGPMAIVGEGRRAHPEYVIPTDPAHRKRAQALWAQAGQSLAGKTGMGGEGLAFARGGQLPMLAGGGIIGGFMNKLKGFSFLNPVNAFKGALERLMGTVPGSGAFRDAVAGIPTKILEQLVAWFKKKVGLGGGPGMGRGLAWAKTQHGKGYQWGGNGNPSWDCSGFVSAIESVIRGQNPHRRWSTHPFHGGAHNPMPGWYRGMKSPYQIGVTPNGVGHVAGTLLGQNVESSGSGGVRVGSSARGASHGMFNHQYGFKADSGALMLKPGWNPPTFNGTGRPELLQLDRPGGGEVHLHLHNHGAIGSKIELQNWLADGLEQLRRQRRLPSGASG